MTPSLGWEEWKTLTQRIYANSWMAARWKYPTKEFRELHTQKIAPLVAHETIAKRRKHLAKERRDARFACST